LQFFEKFPEAIHFDFAVASVRTVILLGFSSFSWFNVRPARDRMSPGCFRFAKLAREHDVHTADWCDRIGGTLSGSRSAVEWT
jgi:hypothetical protein